LISTLTIGLMAYHLNSLVKSKHRKPQLKDKL
jgi:hypothetical protein